MPNHTRPDDVEGELAVPRGSEGELAIEVGGVEFEMELERAPNGRVALTFEAGPSEDDDEGDDEDDGPDDDEYRFVFLPRDGLEDSFEIEVGGRTYLIQLEAGLESDDDEDEDDDDDDDGGVEPPELVAEVEVTPLGHRRWQPFEAELEVEAARGREVDGALEYRGLEIELGLEPPSAPGRRYVLEVEIEDDETGETFEREFGVNIGQGFEREIEVRIGHRVFELELEVERDREDDTIVASVEIERVFGAAPVDDLLL